MTPRKLHSYTENITNTQRIQGARNAKGRELAVHSVHL